MKNKKLLVILLIVGCFVIGGAAILYNSLSDNVGHDTLHAAGSSPAEGSDSHTAASDGSDTSAGQEYPAPDFLMTDSDGNTVRLSDFEGKPVVLNFWASWCGPCKNEMPEFDKLYSEFGDEFHFLMVNLTDGSRETVAGAKEFIEEAGYGFSVYFDIDGEGASEFSVYSIPVTYFIDARGNIAAYAQGSLDGEIIKQGMDMISPAD